MGLHYNGGNDYLFVNGTGIHKDSEIVAILLSLVDNYMKNTIFSR